MGGASFEMVLQLAGERGGASNMLANDAAGLVARSSRE